MDESFMSNMNTIKKFYTWLGQIIEIAEYNDPEEIQFLSEYLDEYDDKYDEWYNGDEYSEESNDNDNNELSFDKEERLSESSDDSDSSTESDNTTILPESNNIFNLFENKNYSNYKKEKENKQKTLEITNFIDNNISTDEVILYKKYGNLVDRCTHYNRSILEY